MHKFKDDGPREMSSLIVYDDKADLLEKLRAMADGIEDGSFPANKADWARVMHFNCCGGGGP